MIALFVILVAWGWYLAPKKTGAHRSSRLSFGRRQSKSGRALNATVIPVAPVTGNIGFQQHVPGAPGPPTAASARRSRIRGVLVAVAVMSAVAALYTRSLNWLLIHIGIDALLLVYYGLSLQVQSKTASLSRSPGVGSTGRPDPVLRRVVGG
ncbi:MAG: hypothetical protein F4W94_09835 [Acidimicrobiia bacterium]|nr:hypothetical protein [Acidimicrobiia bacterium]